MANDLTNADTVWASQVLLEATSRKTTLDAVRWLAEDHPVGSEASWTAIMRALVLFDDDTSAGHRALRRATKEATRSEFDTSRILFDPESIPRPSDYRKALKALQRNSSDGTLAALTGPGLLRAQQESGLAVEALCLMAGVSYSDACDWFKPGSSAWNRDTVGELIDYLGCLVEGTSESVVPATIPSRAVEFLEADGWSTADNYLRNGVPYEVLLAQRAGGGIWLAHKNKTSSFPNIAVANMVCSMLADEQIIYLRAKQLGGDVRQIDLQDLTGVRDKRVGLVVIRDNHPSVLVCFSSAKDSGTARANGDGLLQIPVNKIPFAAVLTGPGWAGRTETDRLAQHFRGLLFTEKTLADLVTYIQIGSN